MAALKGKRVCVVGSGISGLSAAWLLHRCDQLPQSISLLFLTRCSS